MQPVPDPRIADITGYPVLGALQYLLPGGQLRAGTATTTGGDLPLMLALAAAPAAQAGGYAVIGMPHLGVLAAESMGLDVGIGMWIDQPGERWPQVVAVLAEAVPVLLLGDVGPVIGRTASRLSAVLRRTGAIVIAAGRWEGAEMRLAVTASRWDGVGEGHGLLRARRARVTAVGRHAATAARSIDLWLPGPDGAVETVEQRQETRQRGALRAV